MPQIPTNCPSCQTQLVFSETGIDLICPNFEHCPEQVLGRLSYFCSRKMGNIDGLSEKQLSKFIELYGISEIPDLYNLPLEEIAKLDGFGQKSVDNLKASLEKSKDILDYKFLSGLAIDGVGPEIAKLILENLE